MKKYCIQIVLGNGSDPVNQWIETFNSNIIPQIGGEILTKKLGRNKIKNIIFDYRQIQYEDEEDKGTEIIFVFI